MGRSVHSMTWSEKCKKCIQIHHHVIIGFCYWVALVCSAGLGWNGQIIFLAGLALLYGCEFGDRKKKNCSQLVIVVITELHNDIINKYSHIKYTEQTMTLILFL
jgi:hypothetical protein